MKLILIYGPPAVGKLTVANALARLTRYKIFHNHVSVDLVTSVFERGTPAFSKTLRNIRSTIFEEAARTNIPGIIFTMVYETPRKSIIDHYVDLIERHNGQVHLVHLYCDPVILAERVQSVERRQHGKIIEVELLNQVMDRLQDPFSTVSGYES